jgi:hypothetical protein
MVFDASLRVFTSSSRTLSSCQAESTPSLVNASSTSCDSSQVELDL